MVVSLDLIVVPGVLYFGLPFLGLPFLIAIIALPHLLLLLLALLLSRRFQLHSLHFIEHAFELFKLDCAVSVLVKSVHERSHFMGRHSETETF